MCARRARRPTRRRSSRSCRCGTSSRSSRCAAPASSGGSSARCRRSATSASTCGRARRSAWWGSRGAASRPPAARCCASPSPPAASSCSKGEDLAKLKPAQLRKARRDLQIVFQDPYASLNPRLPVNDIVAEPLEIHGLHKGTRKDRVRELLATVGLNPEHGNRYPHEFSGRPAPAHRHRPGAGPRAEGARARRAGVGPRRVHPGRRGEPADRAAGPARAGLPVHRPRPVGGPAHLGPRGGDVPRQDRRDRPAPDDLHQARRTPTRRRCCRRCRCPTRGPSAPAGGWCSPATSPARSTRPRGAGSAPAAPRPPTSARRWSPPSSTGARATRWPATTPRPSSVV